MSLARLTKQKAEELSGVNLDGRRKYFIWSYNDEDVVCTVGKLTITCSGCDGAGCLECGFTGKRRSTFPCPVNPKQIK